MLPKAVSRPGATNSRPTICRLPISHKPGFVSDLYSRVSIGTKVIVLPMTDRRADLGRTIR
jgi:hypothetical protein